MKKIYLIILVIISSLTLLSCKDNDNSISIIAPTGTPEVTLSFLSDDFSLTTVTGPDLLNGAFGSMDYDLIVAPTNIGLRLHNNKFQLLSTIIWGSLYVVSIDSQINDDLSNIDEIYAFGQGTTNDIVFKYVANELDLDIETNYLLNAEETRAHLIQNPSDICILAEPQLGIIEDRLGITLNKIDLTKLFETISGFKVPQASIFIQSSIPQAKKEQINSLLLEQINKMNDDIEKSALQAIESGISFSKNALMISIPNMGIEYVRGSDAKTDIINYIDVITSFNPNLVGTPPEDEFYF